MTQLHDTSILAIDGGGTRCRIALVTGGETLVVHAGSVNVSTDFAAAFAELRRGLEEVARRAGKTFQELTHVPAYLLPEELLLLSGLRRRRRRRHVAAQRLRPEALVRPLRPRRRRHGRGTPEGRVEGARRPRTADRLLAKGLAHLETRTGGTLRSRTV